jgi:hypothetical protein
MTNILEEILNDAKLAYKESVLIDNEILEEKLLSIIGHAKLLIDKKEEKGLDMKNNQPSQLDEIKKVEKRIQRWLRNPNQYNSKILNTFMRLSNNNEHSISVSLLEKHSDIDDGKFITNYNQMKIIAERNHGKVFEETHGEVRLWEPVADFIIKSYQVHQNNFL